MVHMRERAKTQGIMKNKSRVHYLPHRAVVKEGSTTRCRPEFDASCKIKMDVV